MRHPNRKYSGGSKNKFNIKRGDAESALEIKLVDYGWKGEVPEKHRKK